MVGSWKTLLLVLTAIIYFETLTASNGVFTFKKGTGVHRYCFNGRHLAVRVGHQWRHRCMVCRCDAVRGVVCEMPQCKIPFKSYFEHTCAKWSEDGCCCDVLGCRVGGKVYPIGHSYPFPDNDPCGYCMCQLDVDILECYRDICPPLVCVNPTCLPDECCPRCLSGPNCKIPELNGMTSQANLNRLEKPLIFTRSLTLYTNQFPSSTFVCRCLYPGGEASCRIK